MSDGSQRVIERSALGRSAFLGAFYDAREDRFCQGSLFNTFQLPPNCINVTDIPFVQTDYTYEESYAKRFEKLDVNGDLKLSIFAGLIPLSGSAKYIKGEKSSSRSVKGTLIHNIKTKEEKINVFDAKLKEYLTMNALQMTRATHFVGGIVWGANTFASFEYKDVDSSEKTEVKGMLEGQLKKWMSSISGKGNLDYDDKVQTNGRSFTMTVYGDVIPEGEELPQTVEAALMLMAKTPTYIAGSNDGKGKPLSFELYPLDEVLKFFESTIVINSTLKQLTAQSAVMVENVFEDLLGVKQELKDLVNDVTAPANAVCITRETIDTILKFEQDLAVAEADLRNQVREALVSIRVQVGDDDLLAKVIINFFNSSPFSVMQVKRFIYEQEPLRQKFQWCNELLKNGVKYCMRGKGESLENIQLKESEIYAFCFRDFSSSKNTENWKNNYQLFRDLLKEEKQNGAPGIAFFIFEEDCTSNEPTAIHYYSKGKSISKDLLADKEATESLCLIKSNDRPMLVQAKPNKRALLVIRCPGSIYYNCKPDVHSWLCEVCQFEIEYGFNGLYYCKCGAFKIRSCVYKCSDPKHGSYYLNFEQDDDLQQMLKSMKPRNELNILILGETGVGKSTFINAFANYLSYDDLEDAERADLIGLIPTSFTVSDENFEERKITFGQDSNEGGEEGESMTQCCRAYSFPFGDQVVRLIDTPGIGDTRGIEQDRKNFANILAFISNYSSIQGICILMKPNDARLNVIFRFCIQELLCHLHKSASENIVFLFTNARGTFYRPGDTLPPLRKMLSQVKGRPPHVEITLNLRTIYCLDNESFRFLVALKNNISFPQKERDDFAGSWKKSVDECVRLIEHISELKPHKVKETVSLNEARTLIVGLSRPIGDITHNIQLNLQVLEEQKIKIQKAGNDIEELKKVLNVPAIDLEPVHFKEPRTVCASSTCYKLYNFEGKKLIDYSQVCHNPCHLENVQANVVNNVDLKSCAAMKKNGKCKHCGCSWEKHMHIYYENKHVEKTVVDKTVENELNQKFQKMGHVERGIMRLHERKVKLEKEQRIIMDVSAKFAYFLKHNAITPYNDALKDYIDHLIIVEEEKLAFDPEKKELIKELKKTKASYEQEVRVLEENMSKLTNASQQITAGSISACVQELYALEINGPVIRTMVEELEKAKQHSHTFKETIYDYHMPRKMSNSKEQGRLRSLFEKTKRYLWRST